MQCCTLYWDEDGEMTNYEQSMFGEFDSFNRKKDFFHRLKQSIICIHGLFETRFNGKQMTLGYSTLVQVTKTQVFAPTWHVRVELKDGEIEDYFINAIEGKIIEFQSEPVEDDEMNKEFLQCVLVCSQAEVAAMQFL